MLYVGTFLSALTDPFVIVAAVLVGLALRSPGVIWLGALAGGIVFRVTLFLPVFLPFAGLIDIFAVVLGTMAAFFWAAFANRAVRPWLITRFTGGGKA